MQSALAVVRQKKTGQNRDATIPVFHTKDRLFVVFEIANSDQFFE